MNKIEIYTSGMHCHACEVLLERAIKDVPHVTKVEANQATGLIEIFHDSQKPDKQAIETTIIENGYTIWKEEHNPWINPNPNIFREFFMSLLIIWWILLLFSTQKIFDFSALVKVNSTTIFAPLLIGLTAGVSSCMAMVWGIILGLSAKWNEANLKKSTLYRFTPHLWLNLGRIIWFSLFGAILWVMGAMLHISVTLLGLLTLFVAIVMFFLGLNLTELSPKLSKVSFTLPKSFSSQIHTSKQEFSHSWAFTLGVLTFFLPCGFTFAMQLAAIQTGSAIGGATIMGLFALGTTIWLLGVGGITAFFKGEWGKKAFRFMGVIVLVMAFWNFRNGLNLVSFSVYDNKNSQENTSNETANFSKLQKPLNLNTLGNTSNAPVETISLTYTSNGLSEPNIPLKKWGNYKILIDVKDTVSWCMNTILIPWLDENVQNVNAGNTLTFNVHPTQSGTFPLTCAMGVTHGNLVVN